MITALALAVTLQACHADLLDTFEQAKAKAITTYPQHAGQVRNIKAGIGTLPADRNAEVVYGGTKPKLPKGWGFVPVDYSHRVTYDAGKMCALPQAQRHEIVRHEIGHVLARAERGEVIVDEERVADDYGHSISH